MSAHMNDWDMHVNNDYIVGYFFRIVTRFYPLTVVLGSVIRLTRLFSIAKPSVRPLKTNASDALSLDPFRLTSRFR
jgi:hypothetical protein